MLFDTIISLKSVQHIINLLQICQTKLQYWIEFVGTSSNKNTQEMVWDNYFKMFHRMFTILKSWISSQNQNNKSFNLIFENMLKCSKVSINIIQQSDKFSEENTVSLILSKLYFLYNKIWEDSSSEMKEITGSYLEKIDETLVRIK